MARKLFTLVTILFIAIICYETALAPSTVAKEWGDLQIRFLYDGEPPERKTVEITVDKSAFPVKAYDERLVVNQENQGVANVLIYLRTSRSEETPIHSSYKATAKDKIALKLENGRFEPHVLLMRTTQTLVKVNADGVGHNETIATFRNPAWSTLTPAGHSSEVRLEAEETLPCDVGCNIHPWENGYILVRTNPYMAKSDGDGRLGIEKLPVGRHEFQLWHERPGYIKRLKLGEASTDKRGRVMLDIQAGENKLPDVMLKPQVFNPQVRSNE